MCLFGVNDESKAWRLYDPTSRKIVVRKDVVFEEEKSWDWERSDDEIREDVLKCGDAEDNESEDDKVETIGQSTSSPAQNASPPAISPPANLSPTPLHHDVAGSLIEERTTLIFGIRWA